MRTDILEGVAKQSWSSGKVILQIGRTEVATVHHSGGNGLNEKDAVAVASQMAEAWNSLVQERRQASVPTDVPKP